MNVLSLFSDQLHALGNAVVPAVAEFVGRMIKAHAEAVPGVTESLSHLPPGRRAAVDALTNERAHQLSTDLPTFSFAQTRPRAGVGFPQGDEPETQATHTFTGGFPQLLFRSCEQLGGP